MTLLFFTITTKAVKSCLHYHMKVDCMWIESRLILSAFNLSYSKLDHKWIKSGFG